MDDRDYDPTPGEVIAMGSLDKEGHGGGYGVTDAGILGLNDDPQGDLLTTAAYTAVATTLFLIGFFGFFCNLFVIVLMCKDKQLWTPLNVILFNLVCSDFSVSILGNPWTLTASLAHRWIFGRTMCVVYGFFMSLLGINSITTLTVLSFERFMIISKPFRSHQLTKERALVLVVAIWVYSLALTAPPLFGWGNYVNEAANISCSVNWESHEMNATTYIIFLFAMGLVLPVMVICYSYLNIILTLKRNTQRMGKVTKKESRVAYMIFAMIVAFLVAWAPYSVLALIIAFGDPHSVSPGLAVVPALVAKSSICYNPIIYVGLNTQYRSAWKRLLGLRVRESDTSCEKGAGNTVLSAPTQHNTDIHEDRRRLPKMFGTLSSPKNNGTNKQHDNNEMKTIKEKPDPESLKDTDEEDEEKEKEKEENLKPFLNDKGVHEPRFLETAEINKVARPLPKNLKLPRFVGNGHGCSISAALTGVWRTKRKANEDMISKPAPERSTGEDIELGEVDCGEEVQTMTLGDV